MRDTVRRLAGAPGAGLSCVQGNVDLKSGIVRNEGGNCPVWALAWCHCPIQETIMSKALKTFHAQVRSALAEMAVGLLAR
jgi:hypothetical protein